MIRVSWLTRTDTDLIVIVSPWIPGDTIPAEWMNHAGPMEVEYKPDEQASSS